MEKCEVILTSPLNHNSDAAFSISWMSSNVGYDLGYKLCCLLSQLYAQKYLQNAEVIQQHTWGYQNWMNCQLYMYAWLFPPHYVIPSDRWWVPECKSLSDYKIQLVNRFQDWYTSHVSGSDLESLFRGDDRCLSIIILWHASVIAVWSLPGIMDAWQVNPIFRFFPIQSCVNARLMITTGVQISYWKMAHWLFHPLNGPTWSAKCYYVATISQ